jgi:hypothetical protein
MDAAGEPFPSDLWIQFRLEDSDGLFAVAERSLGFRWFFVYLLITTYRGHRKGGSTDVLFLFDEPASNLHQTAQAALLNSLNELSKKAVIIYTTHSHHLINPEWLGTTFVVTNQGLDPGVVTADYSPKRTDIHVTPYRQFAAHHADQSHFFQPILDVLDYAPSQLELVPAVAMVEGRSDYYLLQYFQTVIEGLSPEERVSLLPGGGAGTLDDVIQLYLGWARPFVALLDSDVAGRAQTDRYIDKFGEIVRPHLLSLADASGVSTAKGIESLLAEEDRLAFQRVIDEQAKTYRKKALALGVQEALVARREIKISSASRDALAAVLTTLRAKLAELAEHMAA